MADPEKLKEELRVAAQRQLTQFERNKARLIGSKARLQCQAEAIKAAEQLQCVLRDPHLKEIEEKIYSKNRTSQLVCPNCGSLDRHNTLNGTPFCFACNIPLVDKSRFDHIHGIRVVRKSLRDFANILNPGLNPKDSDFSLSTKKLT